MAPGPALVQEGRVPAPTAQRNQTRWSPESVAAKVVTTSAMPKVSGVMSSHSMIIRVPFLQSWTLIFAHWPVIHPFHRDSISISCIGAVPCLTIAIIVHVFSTYVVLKRKARNGRESSRASGTGCAYASRATKSDPLPEYGVGACVVFVAVSQLRSLRSFRLNPTPHLEPLVA